MRSASDVTELRYSRSTITQLSRISLNAETLRNLENRSSEDIAATFSTGTSMPSKQTKKHTSSSASSTSFTEKDEGDETERPSSRLSNSGGCSPSGTGLSQSLTEMNLRTCHLRPQSITEPRACRSNSLNRSSESRYHADQMASRSSRTSTKEFAGLVGLMNEGNTCYLNSCLQCLAHTLPLASAVLGPLSDLIPATKASLVRNRRDSASLAESLAHGFRLVVKELCTKPHHSTASASALLYALQGLAPQFSGGRQHDAQEAMRTIIDGLHEALNRKPAGRPKCPEPPPITPEAEIADISWEYHTLWNNSVIQHIFCGQLQSTIECSVCQRKSHCFDPFLDLSLPLPKHGGTNSIRRLSIEDCLSAFVAPETLDTSNKYYCSGCKAPQISTKKLSIYRVPSVLVLHIKVPNLYIFIYLCVYYTNTDNRFYGVEPRSYRKDDRPLTYPLTGLDLSNFISSTAKRVLSQEATYDLYGVCTHFGSLGYGHYTATCKCIDNGWYCYNDASVTPVHDPIDSSAYILFYQQRT